MAYTPQQQEAVTFTKGVGRVNAGPGSGKTKTAVGNVEYMVEQGEDPASIVVLTLTNAAADEFNLGIIRPLEALEEDELRLGIEVDEVFFRDGGEFDSLKLLPVEDGGAHGAGCKKAAGVRALAVGGEGVAVVLQNGGFDSARVQCGDQLLNQCRLAGVFHAGDGDYSSHAFTRLSFFSGSEIGGISARQFVPTAEASCPEE